MMLTWTKLARIASIYFVMAMAAPSAQAAAVTILAPAEGAELSGVIEVTATIVTKPGEWIETPALQTIAGKRIRLERTTGDTYTAKLDTTQLPNGRQTICVVTSAQGVSKLRVKGDGASAWACPVRGFSAEVKVLVRNPYRFYRGNLHAHTNHSGGMGTPQEAYEYARDRSRLDFFAVTDHSQLLTADEYKDVIAQAKRANAPGRFVALYGVEGTETAGHFNYYMSPTPRLPSGLNDFYRALSEMQLLGHFNHPTRQSNPRLGWKHNFQDFHYAPAADRNLALVECRSPQEEEAFIALLDAGWHVAPTANEDNHERNWGNSHQRTVALARELTRESILEALWARRVYSAADRNLELTFTVEGEDMGAQLTRPAGPLNCEVMVNDRSGDRIHRIDLVLDGKQVVSVRPGTMQYAWSVPVDFPKGKHYLYARVYQTNKETAEDRISYSAPVWVNAY